MCFSAEASFGAAALLLPAGGYCVWQAFRKNRKLLPVAVIPAVFGVQQFCEGFVWVGLNAGSQELGQSAAFVFLFFALTFWPFWIPFCAFYTVSQPAEKRVLAVVALVGLLEGLYLYVPILLDPPTLILSVEHHSIFYDITRSLACQTMPLYGWQMLYVVVVGVPLLISPTRGIVYLGIVLVVLAGVSQIFFWVTFISMWCFFAAFLSLYLCHSFRNMPAMNETAAPAAG